MAGGIKKTEIVEADLGQLAIELHKIGEEISFIISESAKFKPIAGLGDLAKATKETTESAKELDSVGKRLAQSEIKLKEIEDSRLQSIIKNRIETQNSTKEITLKIKAQQAEKGSIEQLSAVNAILEQRLKSVNQTTDEGRKRAELLRSAIDKNNITIKENSSALGAQKINIGNYGSALDGLKQKFESLGTSASQLPGFLGTAGSAVMGFGKSLWALVANPVGATITAIVVGLTALYKVFTSTASGGKLLKEIMASIGAVFDVVHQRSVVLIDAFKALFSGEFSKAGDLFSQSVSDIGDQMAGAAKEAWNLVDAQGALNKQMAFYTSQQAKENNEYEKALFFAKDKTKSDKERLGYLQKAMKLSKEMAQIEIDFAKEQYKIDTDKAALKVKVTGVTADQLRAFIELGKEEQQTTLKSSEALQQMWNMIGGSAKFKPLEESYAKIIEADTNFFQKNKRTQSQLTGFLEEISEERIKKDKEAKKMAEDRAKMEVDIAKDAREMSEEGQKEIADNLKAENDKIAQNAKEAIDLVKNARKDLTDTVIGMAQEQSDAEKLAFQETAIEQITSAKGNSDKISDIQHQLTLDMIDSERNAKQAILDSIGLEPEAYAQANEQLRRLNIQRKEEEIAWAQKTSEEKKAIVSETMQATAELLSQGLAFSQQIYAAQATRAQETYDAEMNAAGDSLEAQTLAKRKFEAEDKKIKQRQAIASKLQAVLDASLALALAIATTWKNPLLAALNIGAATLGLGMALATPIPQFAEGTDNSPSSFIAGEEGSELIRTKSGKMILTPNKATLFSDNNLIGSTVFPHDQTQRMLANMAFNQVHDVLDLSKTNSHLASMDKQMKNKSERYTDVKGRTVIKRGNIVSTI